MFHSLDRNKMGYSPNSVATDDEPIETQTKLTERGECQICSEITELLKCENCVYLACQECIDKWEGGCPHCQHRPWSVAPVEVEIELDSAGEPVSDSVSASVDVDSVIATNNNSPHDVPPPVERPPSATDTDSSYDVPTLLSDTSARADQQDMSDTEDNQRTATTH